VTRADTKHTGVLILKKGSIAQPAEVAWRGGLLVGASSPAACGACLRRGAGGAGADPGCAPALSRFSYQQSSPWNASVGLQTSLFAIEFTSGPGAALRGRCRWWCGAVAPALAQRERLPCQKQGLRPRTSFFLRHPHRPPPPPREEAVGLHARLRHRPGRHARVARHAGRLWRPGRLRRRGRVCAGVPPVCARRVAPPLLFRGAPGPRRRLQRGEWGMAGWRCGFEAHCALFKT
jgi:hypothetical protein